MVNGVLRCRGSIGGVAQLWCARSLLSSPLRGLPVVDVERSDLPAAFLVLRSCESPRSETLGLSGTKKKKKEPLNFVFLTAVCSSSQFWQLYNSITLFKMFQLPQCKEWQVWTTLSSSCSHFFFNLVLLFIFLYFWPVFAKCKKIQFSNSTLSFHSIKSDFTLFYFQWFSI